MKPMSLRAAAAHFARDRRGVSAPIVALFMIVAVALMGYVIDMGHVFWVKRDLRKSADAAALAGAAIVVDNPSNALALANSYGGTAGGKNLTSGVTVTNVSGYPTLKCFTSITTPSCTPGSGKYNGIQVQQQATVGMWFLQVIGIDTMTVKAESTAAAKGGNPVSLDVMVVLDTTASMSSSDPHCSGGSTRIACAKHGVIQLLNALDPTKDTVGIMVFPGYTSQALANTEATCSPTTSSSSVSKYAPYASGTAPYYTVSSLASGFKDTSKNPPTLDSSSGLVIAGGGGTCGTSKGIQAIGGQGTYYAMAVYGAALRLQSDGQSGHQKVIIFLSDGDANISSSNVVSHSGLNISNQCQQAVAAAQYANAQGMWVYTIAYGASTSTSSSCNTDTSSLGTGFGYGTNVTGMSNPSACSTLSAMASDSSKFYSDGAAGCTGGAATDSNLSNLFSDLVQSLTQARLIPNDTI